MFTNLLIVCKYMIGVLLTPLLIFFNKESMKEHLEEFTTSVTGISIVVHDLYVSFAFCGVYNLNVIDNSIQIFWLIIRTSVGCIVTYYITHYLKSGNLTKKIKKWWDILSK